MATRPHSALHLFRTWLPALNAGPVPGRLGDLSLLAAPRALLPPGPCLRHGRALTVLVLCLPESPSSGSLWPQIPTRLCFQPF